ncbi:MAG: hypothetical protein HY563_04195 [Ignavibacteriales bacterium]|nr:hypothetical protein [Ignavibacteriales bacterium]
MNKLEFPAGFRPHIQGEEHLALDEMSRRVERMMSKASVAHAQGFL